MKFAKLLGSLSLSAIALLGFAGAAQAVENTWEVFNRTSDSDDDVRLCSGGGTGCQDQYSWTHDITDNTGTPDGAFFDPSQWIVTDADLYVYLYDDDEDGAEEVRFKFDGGSFVNVDEVDGSSSNPHQFSFDLDSLLSDGILTVLLDATEGDLRFDYARLVVRAVRRVSEPGTLALLGLGLMSLGFVARRRAK